MRQVTIKRDGHSFTFRWDGNGELHLRAAVRKYVNHPDLPFDHHDEKKVLRELFKEKRK